MFLMTSNKMNNIHLFMVLSTILIFVQVVNVGALDSMLQGQLLTPEQGCGISKAANTKIVGGTEAKPGAFPWIALIGQLKFNSKGVLTKYINCAGSLITSRHVLTATHCITPTIEFVRLGEHNLFTTTDGIHQDIEIFEALTHPNYNRTDHTNDIAVVTLVRDVEFTDRILPVCLPLNLEMQKEYFVGTNPFVAGWGMLEENGTKSDVLMQVQLPVLENKLCEELYKKIDELHSTEQFGESALCAGNLAGGQDACLGDSGGPSVLPILENGKFSMYQIGIIAWGFGCGRPNVPGVYTRVSYYMDWIKSIVDEVTY